MTPSEVRKIVDILSNIRNLIIQIDNMTNQPNITSEHKRMLEGVENKIADIATKIMIQQQNNG